MLCQTPPGSLKQGISPVAEKPHVLGRLVLGRCQKLSDVIVDMFLSALFPQIIDGGVSNRSFEIETESPLVALRLNKLAIEQLQYTILENLVDSIEFLEDRSQIVANRSFVATQEFSRIANGRPAGRNFFQTRLRVRFLAKSHLSCQSMKRVF